MESYGYHATADARYTDGFGVITRVGLGGQSTPFSEGPQAFRLTLLQPTLRGMRAAERALTARLAR